jgi:hypothetical protein
MGKQSILYESGVVNSIWRKLRAKELKQKAWDQYKSQPFNFVTFAYKTGW